MKSSPTAPCWADHANLYHPEDYERLKDHVEKAVADGTPYELELRINRKDGKTRFCIARGFPEKDSNGQVQRLFGSLQDITGHKQAEEKILESEKRYRSLIELSPLGIGITNTKGVIVNANQSLAAMLGYEIEELLGLSLRDMTHPDDLQPESELIQSLLNNEEKSFSLEKRYKHKNGHCFWVNVTIAKMVYHTGNEVFVFGFAEDISNRKQMELEREKLINELQDALAEIKELRGFLPICANCKKIRDDDGYWQQVEKYITDRTDAQFSHSICPDCAKTFYSDVYGIKVKLEKKND
jgi:PAS domain S-box-containing protein